MIRAQPLAPEARAREEADETPIAPTMMYGAGLRLSELLPATVPCEWKTAAMPAPHATLTERLAT
jgi:hypothetical protein